MSVNRTRSDGSWWGKVDRAEKHLKDLQRAVASYCAVREHTVTSKLEAHKKVQTWVYRVQFDGPDPRWSLLAGDFLFDMRAALDHIMIALNPASRRNAILYFPIYTEDPWRRKPGSREYVERNPIPRKNFADAVKLIDPQARAIIERFQPYNAAVAALGRRAEDHALAILKTLHNIDKHRRLLVTRAGCAGARVLYPVRGGIREDVFDFPAGILGLSGAVIHSSPRKMQVKFVGSLAVGFGRSGQPVHTVAHFEVVCRTVRDCLTELERFVPHGRP